MDIRKLLRTPPPVKKKLESPEPLLAPPPPVEVSPPSSAIALLLPEPPEEDSSAFWQSLADRELNATWEHLVKNNLDVTSSETKKILKVADWVAEQPGDWQCMVPTLTEGDRNKKRGKQVPYRRKGVIGKKGVKIGVHQLAAYIRTRQRPGRRHASHFWCDNAHCACPAHIVFEAWDLNITRYCCKRFREVVHYRCPHDPVCPEAISVRDA